MDCLTLSSRSAAAVARSGPYAQVEQRRVLSRKARVGGGQLLAITLRAVELEKRRGTSSIAERRRWRVEAQVTTEQQSASDDAASENSTSAADERASSVALLKTAAKTRRISKSEICAAFRVLDKSRMDPAEFPVIIGGKQSPGRTWMLVYISNEEETKRHEGGGKFFPITAVQRFDSEAMRIENGVFLGPLGMLSFSGMFVWEKRKLAFAFDTLKVKVGPFGPFSFGIGSKDKEFNKNDAFFIWHYADDEIIVGRGKARGTAYWVRCSNVCRTLI